MGALASGLRPGNPSPCPTTTMKGTTTTSCRRLGTSPCDSDLAYRTPLLVVTRAHTPFMCTLMSSSKRGHCHMRHCTPVLLFLLAVLLVCVFRTSTRVVGLAGAGV